MNTTKTQSGKFLEKLASISEKMNKPIGMLIVASQSNIEVKKAMNILLDIARDIDDYYNKNNPNP